jgi:hypothetical protein
MNTKNLTVLAIFTIIIVIAAVVLTQPNDINHEQKKFFPNLASVINEVTEINVQTKDNAITLVRDDKQWLAKDKHNYPVDMAKVNKLLLGAMNLRIIEAKTSKLKFYSKIGVENVTEENAESALLSFKNAKAETIISVIVGKDKAAKVDSSLKEIYLRLPADKQSWLVLGQLPIEKNVTDWLNQEIVNIEDDKIRKVTIKHPDGDSFSFFKEKPDDEDYQLENLAEDEKLKLPYMLRSIATTLSNLEFDDVFVATEIEFSDATTAVFTTFDDKEITMTIMKQDGEYYAKLNTVKDWVYELSKYKVDYLMKKRQDLVSVNTKEIVDNP